MIRESISTSELYWQRSWHAHRPERLLHVQRRIKQQGMKKLERLHRRPSVGERPGVDAVRLWGKEQPRPSARLLPNAATQFRGSLLGRPPPPSYQKRLLPGALPPTH